MAEDRRWLRLGFSDLVAFALLVEAGISFYFAYSVALMFRMANAPTETASSGFIREGMVFAVAAPLYWKVERSRPWLRILAIGVGVYGAYYLTKRSLVISYWSFFKFDIVAIDRVMTMGMVVIGMLAAADHFMSKWQRRRLR